MRLENLHFVHKLPDNARIRSARATLARGEEVSPAARAQLGAGPHTAPPHPHVPSSAICSPFPRVALEPLSPRGEERQTLRS